MSPSGIQEQINELEQMVYDLTVPPSGVEAYLLQYTLDEYDTSVNNILTEYEARADELAREIVEASGVLRILKMGIMIEAAQS